MPVQSNLGTKHEQRCASRLYCAGCRGKPDNGRCRTYIERGQMLINFQIDKLNQDMYRPKATRERGKSL